MTDPVLARTAFSTSRLLDYVSEKELVNQTGYGTADWPLVVVKELVDNALDACEEQGVAPVITVTITDTAITVADNGAGIPADVVDLLLDFSVRVSSREAYVAPDRGAQGNALKTIVAMPFVLEGEEGRVDITGAGVMSEISFAVDRIEQRPVADINRTGKTGSEIRVHWPFVTGLEPSDQFEVFTSRFPVLRSYTDRIRLLVADYTFLNPHLTMTLDLFGESTTIHATTSEVNKWVPSTPTPAHWYEEGHLETLLGAQISHDRRAGRERTVREFVATFKGLTSTIKQKRVLEDSGLSRAPLSALIAGRDFDHELVAVLLKAMKSHSNPLPPARLGLIGRAHLEHRFGTLNIRDRSFEYKKIASVTEEGVPQLTEVAFAALEDQSAGRRLITAVNWSATWVNPFRTLGQYGRSLDTLMSDKRFEWDRPVVFLLHVAHPRVQYLERGKSTVLTQ